MIDRELLELAARAAGIKHAGEVYALGLKLMEGPHNYWNPLTDDGDALRLAVKLGMDILFTAEDVEVIATQHARPADQEMLSPWACESWTMKQQDPYAATRRAIVRAAAEIGKGLT
jgi:hypothetical protein